jgi:hypothetical protein
MSAMNEAAPAAVRRRPLLKRAMARLCSCEEHDFVLQIVQPSLVGMIDGTVSTLAPILPPPCPATRERPCSSAWPLRWAPGCSTRFRSSSATSIGRSSWPALSSPSSYSDRLGATQVPPGHHAFSLIVVTLGGAIVLAIGVAIGNA